MLRQRLTLGPVMILGVLAATWLDEWLDDLALTPFWQRVFLDRETPPPGVVIFLVMGLLSFQAARELATILVDNGILASKRILVCAAITGLLVSCLVPTGTDAVVSVAVVSSAAVGVLLASLLFHSRHKTVEGAVAAAGGTLLAFVYLGLMFGFVLAIRREHSAWVLLWVVIVTKACDIGAFATGKTIGRHKLILWLSPGKTWEGLVGGVVLSSIVGAGGLWVLGNVPGERPPPAWTGALAGVLFGLTGQLGDLIASLFKRDAGIKDSGTVLPGFGGVLDVLDSPLLVAPVAYWWIRTLYAANL